SDAAVKEEGNEAAETSKPATQDAADGSSGTPSAGPLTELGSSNTISEGVYIGNVNVSGKTAGEAQQDVEAYIEELKGAAVNFQVMDGNQVEVTAGELGLTWANTEVVQEAVALGKKGNIIQRYKALQDLRHENKVFELSYDFDKELIRQVLTERCGEYNTEAKDAVLTRENGVFSIIPGQSGYVIDEEASISQIYDYLLNQWDFNDTSVEVAAKVQEPRGTEEELSQVKDVLGTFTTSYSSSGSSRSANVANGCELIAGVTLYPGDEFSTYEAVSPFSVDNGYFMAGSYMNGQVVDSLGGGICQVSTTLYNAVLLSELEVTERHNHSMIVTYVDPSADAAIAESAGKDFKFVNNTGHPIYIDGHCENKNITFTIYG
ncbi:MAG: VanW family protein, partial [Kineothrix sp.]|nr:VanW family protein [Kineothrix sp.]